MKIKKLFKSLNYPYHMVVKTEDNQYKAFLMTPFREITEQDLSTPIPAFIEKGNKAEEAEEYMYKCYKLQNVYEEEFEI